MEINTILKNVVQSIGIIQPYTETFDIYSFTLPEEAIPKQRIDGIVKLSNGITRCKLVYNTIINNGQYGLIQNVIRSPSIQATHLAVKRPRSPQMSLEPEAFLQALCSTITEANGLNGAIPKVYDIFIFANEVRFTMDFVDGINYIQFLQLHWSETFFLNSILQLAYILYVLERNIGFDHRDMNPNNIWIRTKPQPQTYTLNIEGVHYRIAFTHQVVLLDFGFACIGDGVTRVTRLSLGKVIPHIDTCPKDGRDMFHILNHLLTTPFVKNNITQSLYSQIVNWMSPFSVAESHLAQIWTSNPDFKILKLTPKSLIETLAERVQPAANSIRTT